MKIGLWDRHRDRIGGGTMPMIALHNALVTLGHDVRVWDDFHPDIDQYEFIEWPSPRQVGTHVRPDVFVYSCYWEPPEELPGKQNWLYTLYPKSGWDVSKIDRILTTSTYSQAAIKRLWERNSDVLVGGAYADDWYPYKRKSKSILSCSRFFLEGNLRSLAGHSKNQHVLIRAFKRLNLPDWELWLAGSILTEDDSRYLNKCQELADGDERIKFFPTPGKQELRELYSRARIFWHGMGYQRDNPAETEHYGYVLLKACLSGLWVISHDSGNKEFSHFVWDTPETLVGLTRDLAGEGIAERTCTDCTRENFVNQVREAFGGTDEQESRSERVPDGSGRERPTEPVPDSL